MERKERGEGQEAEGDNMIPADHLAEVRDREYPEDGERYDLLNGLELRRRIYRIPDAVRWHRKAILEELQSAS
jgi:hypothetical protein